jgi:hypothetical protein
MRETTCAWGVAGFVDWCENPKGKVSNAATGWTQGSPAIGHGDGPAQTVCGIYWGSEPFSFISVIAFIAFVV